MFKKVLVAEDMDSINQAVAILLNDLQVVEVAHSQYCDQAWLMAKKEMLNNNPYDLLICDLSFKPDYREEKISSGEELISKLKSENPDLKVIVNSIEDHPQVIQKLWDSGNIDAYVCKDRHGIKYLKQAILALNKGLTYNSPSIVKALSQKNLISLNNFEISIVEFLSIGYNQDKIEKELKKKNVKPNSKSAIEKRLKELREEFGADTNPHLIGIMKDLKLI